MSSPAIQEKAALRERVDRELQELDAPGTQHWNTQEKIALACRMLADQGHWHGGLAGQFTAKGDEPDTFWTLPSGVGADEAQVSNLIQIDDDLRPLDGKSLPNPANRFHMWVYRHRPELQCIVHTHPPTCSALSMVGVLLVVDPMDAMPFCDDGAYLSAWPGLPIGDDEDQIINEALGNNRPILTANHGILTAVTSIEEAFVMAIWLEMVAELQLKARA